ncbi:MAG: DNA-3-methyladenine glycosylase 2 family protein [Defluviitaleaceae bacterium]|nr:DNA-3-methyladenine glycosylase 2 family protein [Defluviitaleaceae bacterium]
MDYRSVKKIGGDLVLTGVKNFSLKDTLDCGQCFRWETDNGGCAGIAHGRRLEIKNENGDMVFKETAEAEFNSVWKKYFDLDRDYGRLHAMFAPDEILRTAAGFYPGLRLLRQEPWEALASFIFSQNNNIPRIKKIIKIFCESFGEPVGGGFAFPSAEKTAALCESGLAPLRCGYRAEYLLCAARSVADGRIDLAAIESLQTDEIRARLMSIKGIGPKVADCVLLYGFGRTERCPADVWIKRAKQKFYPGGFSNAFMAEPGIAQQYLFHYARSNKIW